MHALVHIAVLLQYRYYYYYYHLIDHCSISIESLLPMHTAVVNAPLVQTAPVTVTSNSQELALQQEAVAEDCSLPARTLPPVPAPAACSAPFRTSCASSVL